MLPQRVAHESYRIGAWLEITLPQRSADRRRDFEYSEQVGAQPADRDGLRGIAYVQIGAIALECAERLEHRRLPLNIAEVGGRHRHEPSLRVSLDDSDESVGGAERHRSYQHCVYHREHRNGGCNPNPECQERCEGKNAVVPETANGVLRVPT